MSRGATPGRILIRLPNWLGDVLMARPLLHAVRQRFPGARVTALGPPALLGLLAPERLWDEAVAWPPDPLARGRLRHPRAGLALVLPPSFSSAWAMFLTGARRRIGFAGEGRSLLLTDPVRRPARGEIHLSGEYLRLGARAGVTGAVPPPALAAGADGAREAARLRELVGAAGTRYAVLAPGALYGPAKRWARSRWAALARRLQDRGLAVLLCGGASDRPDCVAVAAEGGGHVLAGESSLAGMAALAGGARVVVSNDSGLAHLAAATGAPTVVVFGSTSSAWTAPLGERVAVMQRAPVCAPCFQRTCRIGYRCLRAVTVEQVAAACDAWVA